MSAGSKWIKGTEPAQPVSQAARTALAARLGRVLHYLPLAAEEWRSNTEYVHQLRVSTRRAVATLDAFGELLPAKRLKKMHKRLRHIRKAAGDARDSDVMLARFRQEAEQNPSAAELANELRVQRRAAQRPLAQIAQRLERKGFADEVQTLLHKVRYRPAQVPGAQCKEQDSRCEKLDETEPTLFNAARSRLRGAVDEFWLAAAGDLSDSGELHQLRIAAKSLRYSMELFAGALPGVLREEIYPVVAAVQEALGAVNDHATAAKTFKEWAADADHVRFAEYLRRLAGEEETEVARGRDRFFVLWTPDRQAQLHDLFEQALAAPSAEAC